MKHVGCKDLLQLHKKKKVKKKEKIAGPRDPII